ncbi:hypothetical protein [Asinibacterium sp. OR53]|nr:hypothetical protein [Asinibacterium sp. OR53]
MAKSTKKLPTKQDKKLAIKGSFEDVIRISVGKPPTPQKAAKKKGKK